MKGIQHMVAMRKWGLLLSLVSTTVFAQEGVTTGSFPVARRNVVSLSLPLEGGLSSRLAIEGERVVWEHVSLGLGVFGSFQHDRSMLDDPPASGFEGTDTTQYEVGLAAAARFYLTGPAPQGVWVSPRLEVSHGRGSFTPVGELPPGSVGVSVLISESKLWSLGGAALVGYSVVLEPGFTVQAGVGLGARREALTYEVGGQLGAGETPARESHQTTWVFT